MTDDNIIDFNKHKKVRQDNKSNESLPEHYDIDDILNALLDPVDHLFSLDIDSEGNIQIFTGEGMTTEDIALIDAKIDVALQEWDERKYSLIKEE